MAEKRCPKCGSINPKSNVYCNGCGFQLRVEHNASVDLRTLREAVEQRVGRPMRQKPAKFKMVLQERRISDVSQIDEEFIHAMVNSGWYDGKGSFLDFVAFDERTAKGDGPVSLSQVTEVALDNVAILGGSGFDVVAGDHVNVVFGDVGIELTDHLDRSSLSIPYAEIDDLELGGGTEVSGGGFIGGGFGLDGAAVGMVAASVLNALTTRTATYSLIVVTAISGELFLLYDQADPSILRITLSHAFTRIRQERRRANGDSRPMGVSETRQES